MSGELKSIHRRFSASAGTYEAHAVVQRAVAEKLLRLIPADVVVPRLLEAGCGTGVFTEYLADRFPHSHIDAMDLSERMIRNAKAKLAENPRIYWHVGNIARFEAGSSYPLIASSCSLHWLDHVRDGFLQLSSLMDSGGFLYAALMTRGTLAELHEARLQVAPNKPPLRALPTESDVREGIGFARLQLAWIKEETIRAIHPSATAFLRSIHDQGLTGGDFSRAAVPLNRSEIERLVTHYDTNYSTTTGEVYASYKILFVTAMKP